MNSTLESLQGKGARSDRLNWQAELNCTFESGPTKTIVRRSHVGPLSVQRPFYPEGNIAHVYMLHPPGGVVAGDSLRVNVRCVDGGRGLVSTPGATKFYRSDGSIASVRQSLHNSAGSLEWFPGENIFYSGCKVEIKTSIQIAAAQPLAWWDINCFGTTLGSDAPFEGYVSNVVDVEIDQDLILRERLVVDDQFPLSMSCGLRNNRVTGTMLLMPMKPECVEYVQNALTQKTGFSSTYLDDMLIVRYLGDSSEDAKHVFSNIWSGLRPALNSTQPSLPRIWAT